MSAASRASLSEASTPKQLEYKTGGPPVREILYTADMLRDEFDVQGRTNVAGGRKPGVTKEGEILRLEETLTDLGEGPYHRGTAAVVRLVLKSRPAPQRA